MVEEFVILAVKGNESELLRKGDVMTIAQAASREAYKKPGPEWAVLVMSYPRYLEFKDASGPTACGQGR
jgi:hypothetical protein